MEEKKIYLESTNSVNQHKRVNVPILTHHNGTAIPVWKCRVEFCSVLHGIEVILSSRGHQTLSVTRPIAGWTAWTVFGQHLADSHWQAKPD